MKPQAKSKDKKTPPRASVSKPVARVFRRSHLQTYRRIYRRRKWISFIKGCCLLGCAFVILVATFVFTRGAWTALDVSRIVGAPQSLLVYDKDEREVSCLYYGENRIIVPFASMPQHLIDALVATEDARFFSHQGIDIIRLGGALLANVTEGFGAEGASTLTQQLIKLSHLTRDKTITRKIDEAILAYLLEQRYSKEQILEMYLNFVFFGKNAHGIEAAARTYFGVHASELSL